MQWRHVQQELDLKEGGVCGFSAPLNATSASGPGVDLTVSFRVLRSLNTGVRLSLNDLTLDKNVVEDGSVLYQEGQRLDSFRKLTASVFVDYQSPIEDTGFSSISSASANYVASQNATTLNAAGTEIASTTLMGNSTTQARASFAIDTGKHWRATLFVNNITQTVAFEGALVHLQPSREFAELLAPVETTKQPVYVPANLFSGCRAGKTRRASVAFGASRGEE